MEAHREYGRGNRVRKQVNYCDDENDDQFLNIADEEEEEENESSLVDVPKRNIRRRGRMSAKEIEKSKSADIEESISEEE